MSNLDNFRQGVEGPKMLNLIGYIFPKNKFFQQKYIPRIYLTLRSTNCVKIHLILYVTFANMHK